MAHRKFMENRRKTRTWEQQNEELQIILDSVPAWIFFKDKENRFLRVNAAFCNVMGMSREALEGQSVFDLFPREQAEAFWKDDQEVMAAGTPKRNILEPMDHNGERLWVRTDKIPYRDAEGTIIGIIGFSVDVTARRNAEEELRAAYTKETRLRQEHEQLVDQLKAALARIRTLDVLLPICAVCKKIRDDKGHWHFMESFISSRTDTMFSHGYCPECAEKAMEELERAKRDR